MSDYIDPRDYKQLQMQALMKKISQLESSGGVDTDHAEIKEGVQAGDSAIGEYGLMPNTIMEMNRRFPSDLTEGMAKEEIRERLQNDPEFAKTMADTIGSYIKHKRGMSDEQVAAAWERGHNAKETSLNLKSPRAKKFKMLQKK